MPVLLEFLHGGPFLNATHHLTGLGVR
jgi:hypothetical protein